ncbi:MAG: mechanosensitive ion channel family protein [Nostocaceae cyanobacterium]|nr:mechanosensitive ion channel family protein [Nostocaceae cyanobacterium]
MRLKFVAITLSSMAITVGVMPKVAAQLPIFPVPNLQTPTLRINDSNNKIVTGWVYLDGRRLFQVTSTKANIGDRINKIQDNLAQVEQTYINNPDAELNINIQDVNGAKEISVNGKYLVTLSEQDMRVQSFNFANFDREIKDLLQQGLQKAKQERQTQFLIQQGIIATASGVTMIFLSWGVGCLWRRSQKNQPQEVSPVSPRIEPISNLLNLKQYHNLKEVKRRLFQLTQTGIWGGGSYFILGLFPHTRWLQVAIPAVAQIPLRLGFIGLLIYVGIRFSYVLIDRFASALVKSGALLTPETSRRLQLRISTISGITKSVVTVVWVGVGILVSLATLGIDLIPLLAGASLVGVAVSLASQSLIKDAINGFLIILEDQYALGDVIVVGDMGGLVENLNLRMTQLRDAEGRLITIPNSEIKVVANLSSRWSRADLTIPITYQADVDKALDVIKNVALEMKKDSTWKSLIVDTPQVLGVDNFGDRGLMIRVWIKTQPLKQWDVSREFRRRLKIALDQAEISISVPQQTIWINETPSLAYALDNNGSMNNKGN